jgi:hypothetical protein
MTNTDETPVNDTAGVRTARRKTRQGQGASTKHTPTTEDLIIDAVNDGCTLRLAAKAGGISYETLRTWLRAADDGDERYVPFAKRFYAAEATGARENFRNIKNAGASDWRASAWILEHRYPEEYGTKQRTELSGPDGGPIAVNTPALEQAAQELNTWRETMAASLSSLLSVPPTLPTSPTDTES